MRSIKVSLYVAAALLTAPATAQQGTTRGWWPQECTVQRDAAAGKLTVATRYYAFEHDLKRGGAIARIQLTHGRASNLLVRPIESTVQLASEPGRLANEREAPRKLTFSDLNDPSPSVTAQPSGAFPKVVVEASLRDEKGQESGVKSRTTYDYRWGYVRIHKELLFGDKPIRTRHVRALSTVLDPSLSDYGYRPGIRELMDSDLFSWRHGQIREWGKIRPGTHFDLPLRTRQLPRYVVFANQGIEGIEWFMSDDLYQWDYQMTGRPGAGQFEAAPSTNPLGIELSIYPMILSSRYELPKGGAAPLKGNYAFDYYIGVPILEGHAYNPWLNKSYAVNRGQWVSEDQIRRNAEDGIATMHLHNDGDHHRDGMFWRDGSYPPYPPGEMKKMDGVIATIQKYGMKTAPYFSHHELHQSTEEFKKHGEEWGRVVDDQANLRPNFYYGAHMCLKSGWFDFMKFSIDRVLKNHKFDGVYYDWNLAMFCNNPRHVGKTCNGVHGDNGEVAISETAHWDMDELLGLVEWTRQRVGPDGVVILHNTLAPMFATENFANYVVGMEFSYGRLSTGVPRPNELPLEWNFAGARPRAVIGYGTIAREAPPRLHKLHAITTLMTSVAPWPASDEAIDLYKMLRPLGNLEQYQFEDYRNEAIRADSRDVISAVYSKPGEAYVLLANVSAETAMTRCLIRGQKLRDPLAGIRQAEMLRDGKWVALDSAQLGSVGQELHLAGDSVTLLRLK
ncbi:MAG: hypothetical protein KIT09_20140 [Bryobacteraceae bacterium]|nr:hypothetical protein [Bryobacteraceae bacterium]